MSHGETAAANVRFRRFIHCDPFDPKKNTTTRTQTPDPLSQIGIELGHFLKAEVSGQRVAEVLAIFATSWLTWFHTNILLTRFDLRWPVSWLVMLIMLGTLGHAIHAIYETSAGLVSGFGRNDILIFGSLLLTRVAFFVIYLFVCLRIPLARPMLSKYAAAFAISSVLFLVATVVPYMTVTVGFWIAALVLELLMYPIALMTPHEYQLTVRLKEAGRERGAREKAPALCVEVGESQEV